MAKTGSSTPLRSFPRVSSPRSPSKSCSCARRSSERMNVSSSWRVKSVRAYDLGQKCQSPDSSTPSFSQASNRNSCMQMVGLSASTLASHRTSVCSRRSCSLAGTDTRTSTHIPWCAISYSSIDFIPSCSFMLLGLHPGRGFGREEGYPYRLPVPV